jgi:topoisomerase-4 subunit B
MHEALTLFDMLMGKSAAGDRRDWMEAKGNLVEADV